MYDRGWGGWEKIFCFCDNSFNIPHGSQRGKVLNEQTLFAIYHPEVSCKAAFIMYDRGWGGWEKILCFCDNSFNIPHGSQRGKVLNEQTLFAIYHPGVSCNLPGRVGLGIGKIY